MKRASIVVLLVGCGARPPTPTPAVAASDARVEKFAIGTWEAYSLDDGTITLPNDGTTFGLGRSPEAIGDVLASAGAPRDQIRLDLHPLLVKTEQRVLLFDTGAADASFAKAGKLQDALAATGTTPARITDIFISHGHGDHVLGLAASGALAFPSATIHLSSREWTALRESEEDRELVAIIAAKVAPFEPGARITPEVQAIDTRGHTPGHTSYVIAGGADVLFYLGDVAHHSLLSVQRSTWSTQFDMDREAAEAMRQHTLTKLAADRTRVFAVHFPFPGLGHFETVGDSFAWIAE